MDATWFAFSGHGYLVKPVSDFSFELWRLVPGLRGGSCVLVTTFTTPHLPTSDAELTDFAIAALEAASTRPATDLLLGLAASA